MFGLRHLPRGRLRDVGQTGLGSSRAGVYNLRPSRLNESSDKEPIVQPRVPSVTDIPFERHGVRTARWHVFWAVLSVAPPDLKAAKPIGE